MSKVNARQEAKTQTIETTLPILVNSTTLGKKDCLHILHVDDDLSFLEVSKQILSMENNFEIEDVTSVDEALKKMEYQAYDAVVSDYEMPQKNGLVFLKELRQQQIDIPFILFTGKGREDVAVKALNLGADSYINKNGSPETVYCELADAINKTVERKKSIKLLAASESKYRTLVEKSLQGILVTKAAPLRLVFANEAMGKILGYSIQDLSSLSPEGIMGLVYYEDRAVFFKRMEKRLLGETAESCYEFRAVRKDGSLVWLNAFANRVDIEGQPAVLGMFLDVTENKKARETLRESEQRYRELANCLPDIVFESDIKGQLVFANERAPEISGYTLSDLENGLNILQFIVPEDREKATKNIQRALSGGSYVPTEYTFLRKNGSTFPALILAAPRISDNKIVGLRGLLIDITQRKQTEETLRLSENKYRTLFEGMSEGFALCEIIKDEKGFPCDYRILEVNDAYEKQTGLKKANVEGKRVREFFPDVESSWIEILGKVALTGKPIQFVNYNHNTDKTFEAFAFCPTLGQFAVLLVDTTERKKTEESLEKERKELNRIIDSSPIIIFYKDKAGKFIRVNEAFAQALNIDKEKFFGKTVYDLYPAEIARGMAKDDLEVLETKSPKLGIIEQYESASGMRWARTDKVPILDKNGVSTGLIGFAQDITTRKQAEEALKDSETKFKMYLENSPVAVFVADPKGKYLYVNKATYKLLGYSVKELLDMSIPQIVFEEELKTVLNDLTFLQETGKILKEFRLKNKDGQAVYVSLNAVKLPDEKLIAFCENITERKKTEEALKSAINKLKLVNEKLNVIGSLTRHDVGNKLTTLAGYAYLLKKKHPDQIEILEGLGKMEQAIKDTGAIFEFAKMYEQLGAEELTYIDTEKTLDEAIALFPELKAKVVNECHGLKVLADSFLRQLFYNFIDNTRKYGKKTTTIRIHYEKAEQVKLLLIYEDDGVGISAENKLRLFTEGFSTGGSTGLGLFLVKKMMEVYGWQIQEIGEPEKGAKFIITIPNVNRNGKENFQIA